jgi:hypothetical protein
MRRKNAKVIILTTLIIIFGFIRIVTGQNEGKKIEIINVGDNWEGKVDSAITLISKTDKSKYDTLLKYCSKIEFKLVLFILLESIDL